MSGPDEQQPPPPDRGEEAHWQAFLANPDYDDGRRPTPVQSPSRQPALPAVRGSVRRGRGRRDADDRQEAIGREPEHVHVVREAAAQASRRRGGRRRSTLFADIRGSTALGERLTPSDFRSDRSTATTRSPRTSCTSTAASSTSSSATSSLRRFRPFLGADHARRAVDAATALLRRTGHGDPGGPWVPVGAGVHTGRVWFGTVGEGNTSRSPFSATS